MTTTTEQAARTDRRNRFVPLTTRQIALVCLAGAALWLVAALSLRALAPLGVYEGTNRIILYLGIAAVTWPTLVATWRLTGLRRDQIALGVAIGTAAATILDGLALAWIPALYGGETAYVAGAGAAILWGAGVGIVMACFMNRTPDADEG